jgi:hypothetical protein
MGRSDPFHYRDSDWLDTTAPSETFETYRHQVEAAASAAETTKTSINAIYREVLAPENCLPDQFQHWRFHIKVPRRDELLARIFDAGLFASSHYRPLPGIFGPGEAPLAHNLHAEIVNLFNDRYLDADRALHLANIVMAHLGSRAAR